MSPKTKQYTKLSGICCQWAAPGQIRKVYEATLKSYLEIFYKWVATRQNCKR